MRKEKLLFASAVSICLLSGCSAFIKGHEGSPRDEMKLISFDGIYVESSSGTWPIAFDSYSIDESILSIDGRFMMDDGDMNYYKTLPEIQERLDLNGWNVPVVYSAPFTTDSIYTHNECCAWKVEEIDEENQVTFCLSVDVSPIFEAGKELGLFVIDGDFKVCHWFSGVEVA